MEEFYIILLVLLTIAILFTGVPVAFALSGSAILVALMGWLTGHFDLSYFGAIPSRIYGIMGNETLIAIPLFVFMGVLLERSGLSEGLLETMALLLGGIHGGIGISICIVGGILAASTGIVGATVITMGLISLPFMLKHGYSPSFATGIISASGTLGQIIPPSIVLIILGDQVSSAYQVSQLSQGNWSGESISVGDIFAGALIPSFLLVLLYILYVLCRSYLQKNIAPPLSDRERSAISIKDLWMRVLKALLPPLLLMVSILGSILFGLATSTEAASVGCVGAFFLAFMRKKLNKKIFNSVVIDTLRINSMVFLILIGASIFSLVFRGYDGDTMVAHVLHNLPGEKWSAFWIVMILIFLLGFFLDFFEIMFVIIPIVGPVLLTMGFHPVWFAVVVALNLQTSFLTPPFGFSLFYLRGVAPASIPTSDIYRGAIPFICIQIFLLILLTFFPEIATYLPQLIYSNPSNPSNL